MGENFAENCSSYQSYWITGMRPVDVTHQNAQKLYKKLYSKAKYMLMVNKKNNKGKFEIGDVVRIPIAKGPFGKGYTPNYKSEKFIVAQKLVRDQIVYNLTGKI